MPDTVAAGLLIDIEHIYGRYISSVLQTAGFLLHSRNYFFLLEGHGDEQDNEDHQFGDMDCGGHIQRVYLRSAGRHIADDYKYTGSGR